VFAVNGVPRSWIYMSILHTGPVMFTYLSTEWPKKLAHFVLYALTSSNIDRFSNLFHCHNRENICNNNVTKDPTTPQVCRYTIL